MAGPLKETLRTLKKFKQNIAIEKGKQNYYWASWKIANFLQDFGTSLWDYVKQQGIF